MRLLLRTEHSARGMVRNSINDFMRADDNDDDDDDDDDLLPYAEYRALEQEREKRRQARRRRRPDTDVVFLRNDKDDLYESLGLAKPHRDDRTYADAIHTSRMSQPRRVHKRKVLKKGFATGKSALEWQLYYAKDQPGPGAYAPTLPSPTGGQFSEHYNPSALERLCRKTSQEPGPMSYDVKTSQNRKGIKFTTGGAQSSLDLLMKEMEGTPGPGHYGDTGSQYKCEGSQKFSMAPRDPPTIADKRPTPGPTDYDPTTSLSEAGIVFQGRGKSYLEELYWTRRNNPGPGAYDVESAESQTRASQGCRLLGRPKFYLDELNYTRRNNPGPGAYGIVEIAPSQVACRFGSGTLEEDEVSIGSIISESDLSVTRQTIGALEQKMRAAGPRGTSMVDDGASTLSPITISTRASTKTVTLAMPPTSPIKTGGSS